MDEYENNMDEVLTQHAVSKIMDYAVIPCGCGNYRKIIQSIDPDMLITKCSKCDSQEPLNLVDLAIFGGALLKHAAGNEIELKPLDVTYEQAFKIVEDIQNNDGEVLERQFKREKLRTKLKVIKGGRS